ERDLHDGAQARLVAMGMTLDTPMRIHLASELYGRPPAPVESAAYFAVSELLANVSKHAEARQTWIDIRHTDGTLRGIERRLAALSPREREVLALMAEGRSNAAIAQRMVITERAVAKHTASIFLKLDLQPSDDDNRRVLAVLAYLGG